VRDSDTTISQHTSTEDQETEPMSDQLTSQPGTTHSTWNDRRLFSGLHGILAHGPSQLVDPSPEELPIDDGEYLFGPSTPALAAMLPESDVRRETHRSSLTAAGYYSRASWTNLTALRFVLAFLSMVAIGFWLLMAPPQFEMGLLGALVAVPMMMWALPPLIVAAKAKDRQIDIDRGLPDVLDMLNMGVSQGLTAPQCLSRISREIKDAHPALAAELRIVDQQTQFGSLSQALRNFAKRIDSTEVASFTSLLIQSDSTGTSISKSLEDYSDSMRSSLRERADARANSASFWMLVPVTLCLMPSVFLFLLGPAIVQLDSFFGTQASQLMEDRDNALDSMQRRPRLSVSRFGQNGN
jgi:tight adherence protein C